MTKTEIWFEVIKMVGGIGAIVLSVAAFIKVLVLERIKIGWQTEANQKLEEIKGEMVQYNSSLTSVTNAFLNNYQKVQENRIEAAKALWKAYMEIRNAFPAPVSLALQIMTTDELKEDASNFTNTNKLSDQIRRYNINPFVETLNAIQLGVEVYKPFLGDRCFFIFYLYQGLIGRTTMLVTEGYKKGKIVLWDEDPATLSLAKGLADDRELEVIKMSKVNTFALLMQVAENKLIKELRENINGQHLSVEAAEYINKTTAILDARRQDSRQTSV
jgi:hypothetical protein